MLPNMLRIARVAVAMHRTRFHETKRKMKHKFDDTADERAIGAACREMLQLYCSELFADLAPGTVWIKLGHCGCSFRRGLPQIFLQQHAILIDDEGHHSRIPVLRRISNESESADHFFTDHVALRSAGCVTTLLL